MEAVTEIPLFTQVSVVSVACLAIWVNWRMAQAWVEERGKLMEMWQAERAKYYDKLLIVLTKIEERMESEKRAATAEQTSHPSM